jgi:integrase
LAKVLAESPVTTRNARASLPFGLHWRRIDSEVHLGYRKGKRAGVWLVRWRAGAGYRQAPLGAADDALKAGTLSYEAATKAARQLVEKERLDAAAAAAGPALTVRMAVESYIASRDARDARRAGREKKSDAASRLGRYVIGHPAVGKRAAISPAALAEVALHNLTERHLLDWREALPDALGGNSRQRLVNDLKAALNAARMANRERLPATLAEIIKQGLRAPERADESEPVARDNQILGDGDIARLLRAAREIDGEQNWGGDLFRLVVVLAASGARFSQIARLRVRDVQIGQGRIMLPSSRKGRGGGKGASIAIPIGRDVVDELVPVVASRPGDAPLLERWRHVQEPGGLAWRRDSRGAWLASSEMLRPWAAIRERASLPEAIPYALRHSSIVRGLRSNLPIRLVAALHDTSTAMIERHYAKWITDGLEDMARAAIVPLVSRDPSHKLTIDNDADT